MFYQNTPRHISAHNDPLYSVLSILSYHWNIKIFWFSYILKLRSWPGLYRTFFPSKFFTKGFAKATSVTFICLPVKFLSQKSEICWFSNYLFIILTFCTVQQTIFDLMTDRQTDLSVKYNVLLNVHHAMILGNCPTWRTNSFQCIYL